MKKEPPAAVADHPEKTEAILQQAIRTFAELGYRATDVQLIADRAGVGKGTVYRHFGAKEDLFWATAFEVFKRLRAAVVEAETAAAGAAAKLRAACLAYGRFFDQNPDYLEVFVQDRAEFRGTGPETYKREHEQLLERFLHIVDQGIAEGELLSVDPRITVVALSGLLYGVMSQACYIAQGLPVQEIIKNGVDMFLAGLKAQPGLTPSRRAQLRSESEGLR